MIFFYLVDVFILYGKLNYSVILRSEIGQMLTLMIIYLFLANVPTLSKFELKCVALVQFSSNRKNVFKIE